MSSSREAPRRRSRWEEEEEASGATRSAGAARHRPEHQEAWRALAKPGRSSEDDRESGRRWNSGEGSRAGRDKASGSRSAVKRHDREEAYQHTNEQPHRSSRAHRPSRSRSRSPGYWERDRARERRAYESNAAGPPASAESDVHAKDKDSQPNFESSGLLAAASNNVNGVALKYHEPPEARKPKKKWRCYVYKDGKEIDLLHISRQSVYLLGRDRAVADIPVEHPSVSKQHAVLQYRLVIKRNEFGDESRTISPFLLDLESANGTTLNGTEVQAARYYELFSGDTIKFGASEREWTLLCEE